jgi:hypothetical protein
VSSLGGKSGTLISPRQQRMVVLLWEKQLLDVLLVIVLILTINAIMTDLSLKQGDYGFKAVGILHVKMLDSLPSCLNT